jgi:hypothetical protein
MEGLASSSEMEQRGQAAFATLSEPSLSADRPARRCYCATAAG